MAHLEPVIIKRGGGVGSDFILKGGRGLEVILYLVQRGVTSLKGLLCLFQTPLQDNYCTVPFVRNSRYVNSFVRVFFTLKWETMSTGLNLVNN